MQSITHLTDALYQSQLSKLQDVLSEEKTLRRAIAELEARQKNVSQPHAPGMGQMRQIGADIIWQGWVDRKRRELQAELARCLVRKNRLLLNVQKAFGRNLAAEKMQADARTQGEATRRLRNMRQDQALLILKAAQNR
jgi:hypothetical protein